MLVLSRKINETLILSLDHDTNPEMTVNELFANCPIVVRYNKKHGNQIILGVQAPKEILISRGVGQ